MIHFKATLYKSEVCPQNSEKSDDKTTFKQFPRITERFQSSREADLLLQKFQNKDFFNAPKFI